MDTTAQRGFDVYTPQDRVADRLDESSLRAPICRRDIRCRRDITGDMADGDIDISPNAPLFGAKSYAMCPAESGLSRTYALELESPLSCTEKGNLGRFHPTQAPKTGRFHAA
jgi:hypothetical protein